MLLVVQAHQLYPIMTLSTPADADAAVAYQRMAAAIATVVEISSEAMVALAVTDGASTALTQAQASMVVFSSIGADIGTSAGFTAGTLLSQLQDSTFVSNLVSDIVTNAPTPATQEQIDAIVTILQTSTTAIADATSTDTIATLTEITKVQLVAQGDAGADLANYLDGTNTSLETSTESFGAAVQDASVGVVVPVAYSIEADSGNTDIFEGQSGETPEMSFTVTRSGNTSVDSTVDWAVSGDINLTSSYFDGDDIPSGELTFTAGESSKTISISLAGNDVLQSDQPFTVSISDPTGTSQIDTADAFAVIRDDDPYTPEITIDSSLALEADSATNVIASVSYFDENESNLELTVSATNATVSTSSLTGNLAAINEALASLTVTANAGQTAGSVSIDVSVGTRQGSVQTELEIHNVPTASTPSTNLDGIAGQAVAVPDLAVQDIDGDVLSATITATNGTLSVTTSSTVSVMDVANGLQLYGTATDINQVLSTTLFSGTSGTISGSITLSVDDNNALTTENFTSTSTFNVDIAASAPELTLPDDASVLTQGKPSALTGLRVNDSDSDYLELTLNATEGTLSAVSSGRAVVIGGSTNELTISGSAEDINTTLGSFRFTTDADAASPTLLASLSDADSNSSGDPTSIALPLVVVNNTPPETGGDITVATIMEDSGSSSITVSGINLSDEDGSSPSQIRILSITGGDLSSDIVMGSSGTAISVTDNSVSLNFTPSENYDGAASIRYVVVDPLVGTLNSTPSTITIPITSVNDAAVITPANEDLIFTEDGAGVSIGNRLTISDVDSNQLSGASVAITNVKTGDLLSSGATHPLINTTYSDGVLTLTGTADISAYQYILSKVTYSNSSDAPDVSPRNIDLTITDIAASGTAAVATAVRTITIEAINDG